jgi:hypothetical protein
MRNIPSEERLKGIARLYETEHIPLNNDHLLVYESRMANGDRNHD